MKCPRCNYEWKLPGPQAGGRAKVAKGFAVAGQPDAEARKLGWKKRKALATRSHNATGQGRGLSAYPAPDCSASNGGDE